MSSAASNEGYFGETSKIEEILAKEGVYVSTTAGVSMYPMLRNRRDTIIVTPCSGRLGKYDIPLYKRGDHYVLHRIIKVLPDSYVIRGDNCMQSEHGITDKDIIGVLTGFYRKNKQVNMEGAAYKAYVRLCIASFPIRYVYYRIKHAVATLVKKLKKSGGR